jgi:PAS domain S-box-containing protein
MSIILGLLDEQPFFDFPNNWLGWVGLAVWLGVIFIIFRRLWKNQTPWDPNSRIFFAILFVIVPITSLFFGLHIPNWNPFFTFVAPLGTDFLTVMILSAVPWVFAVGILGPLPGMILAGISGLILAYWGTHSLITVFEFAFLALGFSAFVRHRNQKLAFNYLSHPIFFAVVLSIVSPIIFSVNTVIFTQGSLAERLDFAYSNIGSLTLSVSIPLLAAVVLAEIFKKIKPKSWGEQLSIFPASTEIGLGTGFVRKIAPFLLCLLLVLIGCVWWTAQNETRNILEHRMASAAGVSVSGVPDFMDTGESLIVKLSTSLGTVLDSTEELQEVLKNEMGIIPFFDQLYVLDVDTNSVGGYPVDDYYLGTIFSDELFGVDLVLDGKTIQPITLPPLEEGSSVLISFIAAIKEVNGKVIGVVIGRTELQSNPFARQILSGLESLDGIGGTGFLLNDIGEIIYHQDPSLLMVQYPNVRSDGDSFYDETVLDGTRQITYIQQASGRYWSVVFTLPIQSFQRSTLRIAVPLLALVLILALITVFIVRAGFLTIPSSLKSKGKKADRFAHDPINQGIFSDKSKEMSQQHLSLEQMRSSHKDRLEELNRLLIISQGVASSSLDIKNAIQPVLESALALGPSSVRIVLAPSVMPGRVDELETPSRFGLGESTRIYSQFDDQILTLMEHQDRIVLTNPARSTLLQIDPGELHPKSLLAIALQHENQYYGSLWVAYNTPHSFSQEEVRFITTLAGQTALAGANHRLFWSAEFGRQRLEAILASTPDPVIVTDQRNHLLLVNPAAEQFFGMIEGAQVGLPINKVGLQPELVDLFKASSDENASIELSLADGRFCFGTVSSILAEGKRIGRVCVLRDLSQFKALDSLKSEFVATVSHDLRSPLTLLRGYATMIEMVGDLNAQQKGYIKKIDVGIENMSRMINNLMDLGRIESDIKLKLGDVLVREVIEEVVDSLQLHANQKRIQVHVEFAEDMSPSIEADRAMLQQAMHNLLENAIKYSKDGKDIWIKVKIQGGNLLIEFQDNGIGISPIDKPRLFEKFYRSTNREAKKEGGTGLGLAIVKSIAFRHKGRVWVESKLGKGSNFYFEIPLKHNSN